MATFIVANGTGIDGNNDGIGDGVRFRSLGQLGASGLSSTLPPFVSPDQTQTVLNFNSGSGMALRGAGFVFVPVSPFLSGTVETVF